MLYTITWGKKLYEKSEGVAADFCPICRRASVVEVRRIYSQYHVNYIGLGSGKFVGRLCECVTCTSEWAVQAGTVETPIHPKAPISLPTLLSETYPRFAIVNEERLEQEKALRQDPFSLDAQTRLTLIAEPFFVLDNAVNREARGTPLSIAFRASWEKILCATCLTGVFAFVIAAVFNFILGNILWGFGCMAVTAGLGWLSLLLTAAATRKFMRRRIYPRLASCLAPLQPSAEELAAIIGHIESKCARQTTLKDFLPALEQARSVVRAAQAAGGR